MILVNRILLLLLMILILSLESIFALPMLSLWLFFKFLDRFNQDNEANFWFIAMALALAALLVALFYQLPLSLALLLFFGY